MTGDTNPDVGATATRHTRPAHLRVPFLALVFIGGAAGTASREGIHLAFSPVHGIEFAIFAINITGAFLLGLLLEALVRNGPEYGTRRALRLILGTGFLGAFTTYSALATNTIQLLANGQVAEGIAYGLGTVVVGALTCWAGFKTGAITHRTVGDGR